ncbi:MAG: carbohydrate kinase family protein [Clostridiales bacterium]|nr:carbohydrate kinase family protein [Clostridiales bacterium]
MDNTPFVTGFGSTNVDLLYSGMPRVPQEGEEIYARDFTVQIGGGYPATLVNVGRLGIPARIQTFLGKDMFSRFAKAQYEEDGVIPLNLYTGDRMPVNVTSAVITPRDRAFTSYTDPVEVTDEHRQQVLEASRGAAVALVYRPFLPIYPQLRRAGTLLVYDGGWWEDMRLDNMADILEAVDFYIPNELEAMRVTQATSPGAAARVLAEHFEHVVVKLGGEGCLLYSGGRETVVPPLPGIKAVDTTGAGDAFLAGFVYGLIKGAPLPQAVLYGNITGAACVEKVGALTGFVTEHELLAKAQKYAL